MKVCGIKTRLFKQNDNLFDFLIRALPKVSAQSVIVITSKIVSLSENRIVDPTQRESALRKESVAMFKTKYVLLTLSRGMLMANAGIDDSNGNGKLVLLPKNSMRTAEKLRSQLTKHYKIKELGIVITDSNPVPLRAGVVGIALGYAGVKATNNYKGKPDLFGRKFKFAQANIVDSLAAAANLVMGEGAEQTPLAVITEAPVVFTNQKTKVSIPLKDDMYEPLITPVLKKRQR